MLYITAQGTAGERRKRRVGTSWQAAAVRVRCPLAVPHRLPHTHTRGKKAHSHLSHSTCRMEDAEIVDEEAAPTPNTLWVAREN